MYKGIYSLLVAIVLLSSCNEKQAVKPLAEVQTRTHSEILPGTFVHSVYFWLGEPTNEVKNTAFEESVTRFLDNCKHIKTYHLGRPAGTNRPIIDTSYTFALIVTFDSKVEHDLYQEDPLHKAFIKESESLWSRVQIYDSLMR